MGKILNLHFLKELGFSFSVGLLLFTSILLVNRILRLVEMVVNQGVPTWEIVSLFLTIIPSFLQFTLPMSLLLALLVTFGRMTSDNEIIACKSAGISLFQMMYPVAIFAVLVLSFHLYLSLSVIPRSNRSIDERLFKLATSRAGVALKEHVFLNDFQGLMIHLDHVDPKTDKFSGVLIADNQEGRSPRIIFAEKGELDKDENSQTLNLKLRDGSIHVQPNDQMAYRVLSFADYELNLDLIKEKRRVKSKIDPEYQLTIVELSNKLKDLERNDKEFFSYRFEMHKRFALSFSCLVFALIGLSLGVMPQLASKSGGFFFSLMFFMLYYFLYAAGEDFGRSGRAPIWLMAWMPNLVFGIFGLYLLNLAAHEKAPLILTWYNEIKFYFRRKLNPETK